MELALSGEMLSETTPYLLRLAVAAPMPRLPRSGTLGFVHRMSCFGWAVNVHFWRIRDGAK